MGRFKDPRGKQVSGKKSVPQGRQATPLIPPPTLQLNSVQEEVSGPKGSRKGFPGLSHGLISIRVTDSALCYKGPSHETQGRGSIITKCVAILNSLSNLEP